MGLDMYLTKKTYVKNWDHTPPERRVSVLVKVNGKKHPTINTNKIINIEEDVMYWRKVNAIHDWFVKNCQNGVDDCRIAYVDAGQLRELVDTCKKVIANPELAEKLLPTTSGFFFGSTDYDEYYLHDLQETADVLEKELSINESADYYYQSSW